VRGQVEEDKTLYIRSSMEEEEEEEEEEDKRFKGLATTTAEVQGRSPC